jgi:5-methylcytosine-specific restriction endonuclease McrA
MLKQRGKHYNLWVKARRIFVKNNPEAICAIKLPGCSYFATDVDHILGRGSHPQLRYVQENLRWACRSCHSKKTDQKT